MPALRPYLELAETLTCSTSFGCPKNPQPAATTCYTLEININGATLCTLWSNSWAQDEFMCKWRKQVEHPCAMRKQLRLVHAIRKGSKADTSKCSSPVDLVGQNKRTNF